MRMDPHCLMSSCYKNLVKRHQCLPDPPVIPVNKVSRILLFSLIISLLTGFYACNSDWKTPKEITGNWKGKMKVSVRYNINLHYSFVHSTDSVPLLLNILPDGKVSGTFGGAMLVNCIVKKNRGWLGKKLDLGTDYVIKGQLAGSIFSTDTLSVKTFSLPFNLTGHCLDGDIFQKDGYEIFPMANVDLCNKK